MVSNRPRNRGFRPTKPKDLLAGAVTIGTMETKKISPKTDTNGQVPVVLELKYKQSYVRLVQRLTAGGYTKQEIAQDLGIGQSTLWMWCSKYPDFARAFKVGLDIADDRVEHSLYEKAVGYKWTEETRSKSMNEVGEEVEMMTQITKQLPPDNSAIFFWLKNRRGHRWKDKHEVTVNHNVNLVTNSELNQLVYENIKDGEYKEIEGK